MLHKRMPFKIPPRRSEVLQLREQVQVLQAQVDFLSTALAPQLAAVPQPPRENWQRTSAPDCINPPLSPLLQLLKASQA
jgi:hypothetical protein